MIVIIVIVVIIVTEVDTPSPPITSFPTKSPQVELSGKPPIKFNGHENSHQL